MSLDKLWYRTKISWTILLWPLELIFICLSKINRKKQRSRQWVAPCPLIVVGNISVGGTGKSPLTICLIEYLQGQGYQVGVVSRGYGAKRDAFPYLVKATDQPSEAADEPLMIAKRTAVNVVIDPNRVRACQYLLAQTACDIILSDDGLQHYQMARDIEIAVVDGKRGLGNRHCLPVGPLRESAQRLNEVDFVVCNGGAQVLFEDQYNMQLDTTGWYRVTDNHFFSLDHFLELLLAQNKPVHALAGIGNPQRFFDSLAAMSIDAQTYVFADHYQYSAQDFAQFGDDIVCMTEKDAVKCQALATEHSYYLQISAKMEPVFFERLLAKLSRMSK